MEGRTSGVQAEPVLEEPEHTRWPKQEKQEKQEKRVKKRGARTMVVRAMAVRAMGSMGASTSGAGVSKGGEEKTVGAVDWEDEDWGAGWGR